MNQNELNRNIWKHKDILATCGYGIIIFIVWGFIKQLIYSLHIVPTNEEIDKEIYSIVSIIANIVLLGICLTTGFLAGKYGKKDKKEKPAIFILSIILSIFSVLTVLIDSLLMVFIIEEFDILSLIAVIMDLLFCIFVIRIASSVFTLKKLYKIREANNNEC